MPQSRKEKKKIDTSEDVKIGRVICDSDDSMIRVATVKRNGRFWCNISKGRGMARAADILALMDTSPKALAGQPEIIRDLVALWLEGQALADENNEAIDAPDKETPPEKTTSPATTSGVSGGKGYRTKKIVASWVASKGEEVRVVMDGAPPLDKEGTWWIRDLEQEGETTWLTLARNRNGKIPQDAIVLDAEAVAAC